MLKAVSLLFEGDPARINSEFHQSVSTRLRWRDESGFEGQRRRRRRLWVQSLIHRLSARFRVCLGKANVGRGKVAKTIAQLCSFPIDPYMNAAEVAVPFFVVWIVSQRVVGGTVVNAPANGHVQVIAF